MRTRREFFALAGRLGVGTATLGGLASPRPAPASPGTPRTIELEVREIEWRLAPGKTASAMTYNGQVPGPEIRASGTAAPHTR